MLRPLLSGAPLLLALLPPALLPAVAFAESPTSSWISGASCTDRGCCTRGHSDPGSWCVGRTQATVLTPDGTSAAKVRYIQEHLEDVKAKRLNVAANTPVFGLADEEGVTLIAPRYLDVVALSSRVLLTRGADGRYSVMESGKTDRPVDWIGVESVPLPGGIPVRLAVVKGADGAPDLAPIQLNGELGPVLDGASCANGGCAAAGNLVKVKVPSSGTVLIDVTGKVVKTGSKVEPGTMATVYDNGKVKQEAMSK